MNYVLFDKDGVPLRAQLDISLKEFRPAAQQVQERPESSPTVEKSYVVRRGDTLSSISQKTGVSIQTLQALNHKLIDPNSLQTAQRLRLRR